MRIAVIGCGSIGRRHIGTLLELGCDVYAYDPSSVARNRARQEHPSARTFGVLGGDEPFSAYVIATPHHMHLYWVEEAVRRGIPFFVEKPLGALEQLSRWRELAAAPLPVNQVGYMLRFHPKALAMKAAIPSPMCGRFQVAADMSTWPGVAYGPMLLEFSHEIDLALWCGAEPVVTYATLTDNRASIALGPWWVSMQNCAPYLREWSIGDEAHLYQQAFLSPEELGVGMYLDELEHFLACVQSGQQTACTLADGLAVLEVCAQVAAMARPTVPPNRVIREGSLS